MSAPNYDQLVRGSSELFASAIARIERWLSSVGISDVRLGSVGALSILLASSSLFYLLRSRNSQHRRPPIISYWIPWLGSALQIHKDPDALFRKAHRELGPVFGVKAFGGVMYHVADADLIATIYKQPNVFSSSPMQTTFLHQIFDLSMHAITGSDVVGNMLQSHHRHLSPVNVNSLLASFITHARVQIQSIHPAPSIPLLRLTVEAMQKADCAMLFGSSFLHSHYDIAAPAFDTFDTNVPLLAVNFPPVLMPSTIAARRTLIDRLSAYFSAGMPDDASGLLKEFEELGKGEGWTTQELGSFALGLMWPLLANAPYAVYWLLAFHLRRPEGLSPVISEIEAALASGRGLVEIVRDSSATPYLDACVNETIRLASDSYSVRWVPEGVEDARLGEYVVKGGDQVICNMRGVHMDEKTYDRADEFEPGRFVNAKGREKGKFIPFGGGFSICEGRHLAVTQIKAFLILLLSEFKVESKDGQQEACGFSPSNRGFGMIRPAGDINVRLTRR